MWTKCPGTKSPGTKSPGTKCPLDEISGDEVFGDEISGDEMSVHVWYDKSQELVRQEDTCQDIMSSLLFEIMSVKNNFHAELHFEQLG